jgi:DNA-binding MarR family transcriptional regulator
MVLEGLTAEGPQTPRDLSKGLKLAPRTVTYALQRLLRVSLCRKVPNLCDMRQPLYVADPKAARQLLSKYGMDSTIREHPVQFGMR